MTEEIDWERVAKSYQIENEVLRREVSDRRNPIDFDIPFDIYSIVAWVEKHYLFVIAMTFVLSYVITTTIDIVDRRTSRWQRS